MFPIRIPVAACLIFSSPVGIAMAQVASGGLPPEWEIKKNMEALVAGIAKIKPVLDQIQPKQWVDQGAPDGYITQHQDARKALDYLARSAESLGKRADRLTQAMDAYFRMQFLESALQSLAQGIRRYQNPALGDLVDGLIAENSGNREKLRQYMLDLAAQKESEFDLIDREAQRCRSAILGVTQRPVAPKPVPKPVPAPKPAAAKPALPKGVQ